MMHTILVDSSSLAYRSMYTLPSMSTGERDVAIIWGFLQQLLRLATTGKSYLFSFAFDSKKSYRKLAFPGYKNRNHGEKTAEDILVLESMQEQIRTLYEEVLPAMGWGKQVHRCTGLEADDIIASLVHNNVEQWTIVSTDADLYQLLCPNVNMYNPNKKAFYTHENFIKEFGIEPILWSEVKALAGCSSDTVPGLPGIGEGRAIEFLRHQLKPSSKAYQTIAENNELREFYRSLVKLPHSLTPIIEIGDRPALRRMDFENVFYRYGFNAFLKEMPKWTEAFNLK